MSNSTLLERFSVLSYGQEIRKGLRTLAVVATRTTRFRNRMLSYIIFPEGLKVLAHIRNGFALPLGVNEFIKDGDVLIFESKLEDALMQRLVF
jgi:hypothetical protein